MVECVLLSLGFVATRSLDVPETARNRIACYGGQALRPRERADRPRGREGAGAGRHRDRTARPVRRGASGPGGPAGRNRDQGRVARRGLG